MNNYTARDHTFIVCAHEESEFLQQCIDSLLAQTEKSRIVIATSTPNEHIKGIATINNIELRVNTQPQPVGIAGDWSFAYKQAGTRLITLAHQDDIYLPDYLATAIEMLNKAKKPLIFFSHYAEIKDGETIYKNKLLNVKKLMLAPMKLSPRSRFIRRRVLSLGSPICCPAVTYADLGDVEFSNEFKCSPDWHKWEELSKLKGSFVYCDKPLMCHRIHAQAETSKAIKSGTRAREDYIMFRKFWLAPIARLLARAYKSSEKEAFQDPSLRA